MRSVVCVASIATLVGCGSCDAEESQVPFGLDAGPAVPAEDEESPPESPPFAGVEGQQLPEGTTTVAVEGAPVAVEAGSIRSLLALDLDDDGDRDALLVVVDDAGISLAHARREGAGFLGLRTLGTLAVDGCETRATAIRTVAPEFAVASVDQACEDGPRRTVAIVSVEAEPRVRERVALLSEEGRTPGEVRIELRALDRDEDDHTDVVLDVTVTPEGGQDSENARASIAWLDRPGGLARDTAEPEATLAGMARDAEAALRREPADALAIARRTLALHAVLCREAGAPRLRFGDTEGLSCRASAGAGAAAATAAAALAQTGDVFAALEAAARLDDDALRVTSAQRRAAERALGRMETPRTLVRREGPPVSVGTRPAVHLPLLGFTTDGHLLVRGPAPRVLNVETFEPILGADVSGDARVLDPSRALVVVGVGRSCDGHVLRIARARDVVAGVLAGRVVSEPLLEPRAPPAGATCPDLAEAVRSDDGGWQVVGWAPQGVVAVRRDSVRLVPLTLAGAPAGNPSLLDDDTPPPVPLPPGAMSRGGESYALATPWGIAIRHLGPPARTEIWRPAEFGGAGAADVAVAPDGRTVAFVRDGRIIVVTNPE